MPRKPADQTVHRDDILLAAARVFHERGYHGATMQDISAAVGLTPGSLYHHFKDGKESILIEVLAAGVDWVTTEVQRIARLPLPPDEKLRQAIHVHVMTMTENQEVAALMIFELRTILNLPEVPQAYLEQRDNFSDLYEQIIEEGIQAGLFAPVDARLFTLTLLGAANWVGVWYRPQGRLDGPAIAEQIADTFLKALQQPDRAVTQ